MGEMINLIAEDRRTISYRPRLNELTGSVTATIWLQQVIFWWVTVDRKPFYKFNEPCGHDDYREGDSWIEELGFTINELRTARSKVATKITKGVSKDDILGQEEPTSLVLYWTDRSRKTWYELNEQLLDKFLASIYICNSGMSIYQTVQSAVTQNAHSGVTYSTETTSENTIDEHTTASPDGEGGGRDRMFEGLCHICGIDWKTINSRKRGELNQAIGILKKAEYTPEDLWQFWLIWKKDWRYQRDGRYPTIQEVRNEIGKVKGTDNDPEPTDWSQVEGWTPLHIHEVTADDLPPVDTSQPFDW